MRTFFRIHFCLLLVFSFQQTASAAGVDTVAIYSTSMHKSINCVVIKPGSYKKKKKHFPVVYLLHGYSGDYTNWIKKVPQLQQEASKLDLLIVCPDGGFSSWYFDSPVDTAMRYETHIINEVIPYIDAHYRTIPGPNARAITGLSMGGHGGLFLGLRHRDVFGACGSMSGGVNLNASRQKYDIAKRIGDTVNHIQNWKDYSVYYLVEKYRDTKQGIIIDCGTADFFYTINHELHEKLLALGIPHDYTERPGVHDWKYWANAVPYQLHFFADFFRQFRKV